MPSAVEVSIPTAPGPQLRKKQEGERRGAVEMQFMPDYPDVGFGESTVGAIFCSVGRINIRQINARYA